MNEILDLKLGLGMLDLKKYKQLLSEIEDISSDYDLDINIDCSEEINGDEEEFRASIFELHSKLGNNLSELEFKLNQIRIQASLKALDLDRGFNLNKKLKFSELTDEAIKLLNDSRALTVEMKNIIL